MPRNGFQELGHGEDGTGTEPAAHVVAADVIEHRVARNLEDVVLQLLQRGNTGYLFLGRGIAEDKVAKAHVLLYQLAQIDIHLLRVLIDKMETLGLGLLLVDNLRTLQNEGHILVATTNLAQQLQTGLWIALLDMCQATVDTLHRETGV